MMPALCWSIESTIGYDYEAGVTSSNHLYGNGYIWQRYDRGCSFMIFSALKKLLSSNRFL